MKINETIVHKLLIEDSWSLLKGLSIANSEYRLYDAMSILRGESFTEESKGKLIGRIDLIMNYHGERLVTEIKFDKPTNVSNDFWTSLKVIGYYEYYKWQTGIKGKVRPAIIVPLHSIKLEQQIIASKLELRIFGVYEENGKIKLKYLDDRPIWRQ